MSLLYNPIPIKSFYKINLIDICKIRLVNCNTFRYVKFLYFKEMENDTLFQIEDLQSKTESYIFLSKIVEIQKNDMQIFY